MSNDDVEQNEEELDPDYERYKRALWRIGLSDKSSRPMGPDYRAEPRLDVDYRGMCQVEGRFEREPIQVKDISVKGLRFSIKQKLEIGETVSLMLIIPGSAPFRINMEVRWVAPYDVAGVKNYMIGVLRMAKIVPPAEPNQENK